MEGPLLSNSETHIKISGDSWFRRHEISATNNRLSKEQRANRFKIASDFVITLVQIIAAIVIVTQEKDVHPETNWTIAYACGCIANFPIICWTFWVSQNHLSDSLLRVNLVMVIFAMMVQSFFVVWFSVFTWVSTSTLSPDSTPLVWLSAFFTIFSFFRYVIPCVKCATICVLDIVLCNFDH